MIVTRPKQYATDFVSPPDSKDNVFDFFSLIAARDYIGALSLLYFKRQNEEVASDEKIDLWIAYCAFHAGEYGCAAEEYERIQKQKNAPTDVGANLACCKFYLGQYKEAFEIASKGIQSSLQNRLLFQISLRLNDEKEVMHYHSKLQDVAEDHLCLASVHFLRSHYQEAIDVYKKMLLNQRSFLALNVYLALCYYKLDYYDVSLEVLQMYLQQNPDSVIAINLKACNHYKVYDGKSAETGLKLVKDAKCSNLLTALLKHNMVVFRNGEDALQQLPQLINVIPEARLNLIIYYLQKDQLDKAYELVNSSVEPASPSEFILAAVVYSLSWQKSNDLVLFEKARSYFSLIGNLQSECDTIPGRQCMASAHFLAKDYDDALIYLDSIKTYLTNDDTFNFMYGQTVAFLGNYKEAEKALLLINDEKLKSDYAYVSNLVRSYIMNGKAKAAWNLYLNNVQSQEKQRILLIIANDCYRLGQFYYAAKAFDVLERLNQDTDKVNDGDNYKVGKIASSVGVFQYVVAGKEASEHLSDISDMLQGSLDQQSAHLLVIMRKWAKSNQMPI